MSIDKSALDDHLKSRLKTLLGTKPDSDEPLHTSDLRKIPVFDWYTVNNNAASRHWFRRGMVRGSEYREAKQLEELRAKLDTTLLTED